MTEDGVKPQAISRFLYVCAVAVWSEPRLSEAPYEAPNASRTLARAAPRSIRLRLAARNWSIVGPHDAFLLFLQHVRKVSRDAVEHEVAMTITGHRTRSVFDRYHIVTTGDQAEALRKVARNRNSTATGTVWAQSEGTAPSAEKSG